MCDDEITDNTETQGLDQDCQSQNPQDSQDNHDGVQFYPPEFWGLGFHFHTFNKLYNTDILNMKSYPMFPGAFAYNNHPIYKADVLGVVVKVEQNQKCFMYADPPVTNDLPSDLQVKVSEIHAGAEICTDGYKIGDLIHVRGKLKIFRDLMEVIASYHINDPMIEVCRMAELPLLYRQRYDKPFQLPHKVAQDILIRREEDRTGKISEKRLVLKLKIGIEREIQKNNLSDFDTQTIMNTCEVQSALSKFDHGSQRIDLLEQALVSLEQDRKVCRISDRHVYYEVIKEGCMLEQTVLKILKMECSDKKYAETGCHYLHIVDRIHRIPQYSKAQTVCVLQCLQNLELQSLIIRTTQKHFLAYNI